MLRLKPSKDREIGNFKLRQLSPDLLLIRLFTLLSGTTEAIKMCESEASK